MGDYMTVSQDDRDAMARILSIMNGEKPSPVQGRNKSLNEEVILAGPGQVTSSDINAMANVLNRLNTVFDESPNDSRIFEPNTQIMEALETSRIPNGVKVGRYQIMIKEDAKRLAGKQYYSIYNSVTNDTIADDISLYETALSVIRLLNSGKFANCPDVRQLFEADDAYTSHRVDALMFKRRIAAAGNSAKKDIYESRYQASLDRCMSAKRMIKSLAK